jgi:sn-glycerol 3-phosphate transport system permease protein
VFEIIKAKPSQMSIKKLAVTNSIETRPLTVRLGIFGAPESGVDGSIISAATLMSVAPLLIAFLLFQRQFVQSFMHAGIK